MGTRKNRLPEAVLTGTHNLCFQQKYEKYQNFLSENFPFLFVKFSIYLNRRVFVICSKTNMTVYLVYCTYPNIRYCDIRDHCKSVGAQSLRKHSYSNILKVLTLKNEIFQIKIP